MANSVICYTDNDVGFVYPHHMPTVEFDFGISRSHQLFFALFSLRRWFNSKFPACMFFGFMWIQVVVREHVRFVYQLCEGIGGYGAASLPECV
jgi:hypothetical protein